MQNLPINLKNIELLCQKNHIEFMGIFGSTARGEASSNSDVDILVRFSPSTKVGYFKLYDIEQEIAQQIGRPIDLITQNALSPYIKDRVYTELQPIYGEP